VFVVANETSSVMQHYKNVGTEVYGRFTSRYDL